MHINIVSSESIDTHHTLRLRRVAAVREIYIRTFRPGQLGLETLREVKQAPGDNCIIIQGHIERNNCAADSDT